MLRRAALVQHAPLFADISQTECREIVSRARERQYRRHQTIFLEGDPARNVILLMHGNIKIMQLGQIGSEVILRVVWSGDLVGEEGLSLQSKHRSTAQPLDDATVLVWDTSVFEALADRFPCFDGICRTLSPSDWKSWRSGTVRFPQQTLQLA
jgi:CRP/FNR family transcriptional regulator